MVSKTVTTIVSGARLLGGWLTSEGQSIWRDKFGLAAREPQVLRVEALDDQVPTVSFNKLRNNQVVLSNEVLAFEIQAGDDFGVKRIGLEWQGINDPIHNPEPSRGEKIVAAGAPIKETMTVLATFSADRERLRPQSLRLRAFAEDYLPKRERSYSPYLVLHVLTPAEHFKWLTEQMSQWAGPAQEVYDKELQLNEINKELRDMAATINKNEVGQSTIEAEFWADTLDRWAEQLVDPLGELAPPPAGLIELPSFPPEVILEVMRIIDREIQVREETRELHQARAAIDEEVYKERASELSQTQAELARKSRDLAEQIKDVPYANELGKNLLEKNIKKLTDAAIVMDEVQELLATSATGPPTIAAILEVLEILLDMRQPYYTNKNGTFGQNKVLKEGRFKQGEVSDKNRHAVYKRLVAATRRGEIYDYDVSSIMAALYEGWKWQDHTAEEEYAQGVAINPRWRIAEERGMMPKQSKIDNYRKKRTGDAAVVERGNR